MPALNFQRQFASAIRDGKKRQTIRAYRADRRDPKPGDTLYLYTGQRSKKSRLLRTVTCKRTFRIELVEEISREWGPPVSPLTNRVAHGSPCKVERLAKLDGFKNGAALFDFFRKAHGLPFRGLLIRW